MINSVVREWGAEGTALGAGLAWAVCVTGI